jgi:threonine aldolase
MTHEVYLASDNWAPAHPLIVQSVIEANEGDAPAYGADPWTLQAEKLIQDTFRAPCKVLFVPTGTGANILALMLACQRHESVLCTDSAHIQYQESGAAEALVGCKLLTVPHRNGKITPQEIRRKLVSERAFGKHSTAPRVISVAQSTEVGTVYTLEELKQLSQLCKEEKLLLHIDGSRLYNAAAALGCGLHELVEAAHADLLSLGGTKNGLLGAEALVLLNPALEKGADHLQKQALQLLSKMRYLSAQYIPFFKEKLWQLLAEQANLRAQEIASFFLEFPQLVLSYPVETNQLFFTAPEATIAAIQEKIRCHLWDKEKRELRFIASWNTSQEEVAAVKRILSGICL